MAKSLSFIEQIDRSLMTTYRKRLWTPFIGALKQYRLMQSGDRIGLLLEKDPKSFLLFRLFLLLERQTEIPFRLFCFYSSDQLPYFEFLNASLSDLIPVKPCDNSAILRNHLQKQFSLQSWAALTSRDQVIEQFLDSYFFHGMMKTIPPKKELENGLSIISPLYQIPDSSMTPWIRRWNLPSLIDESDLSQTIPETRKLLASLQELNPDIQLQIFNSLHHLQPNTFPTEKGALY